MGLLLVLVGCSDNTSIAPPSAPPDNVSARAQDAQRALDEFAAGLRTGRSASGVVSAHSPRLVPNVTANARRLAVRSVSFNYIDSDDGALTATSQDRWGATAWVAIVGATYRLAADPGRTQMDLAVTFTRERGQVRIGAIGGHGHRSALWLDGATRVGHRGPVWVINSSTTPLERYLARGITAVRQVRMVLPKWRGPLVIEVPRDEAQLDSVLDADPETYVDIAGVTTTPDGSLAPGAPIHVFLNPAVYGTLRGKGAQVVLTHESTHVATKAPLTAMPTWLSEGFADYVALDHAGVPFSTAARQILERVRTHGAPKGLPNSTDLAPTAQGLGATYEEAWTVCRYLGQTYGEARLVRFYDTIARGTSPRRAFTTSFGVSQAGAVAGWRMWLEAQARAS